MVLVCLATLFNGFAAAASSPAIAAHEPCEMSAGHDTGNAPCDDCDDSSATCLQQCAALHAGMLLAQPAFAFSLNARSEGIAAGAAASFDSHAGPPGFQPPR